MTKLLNQHGAQAAKVGVVALAMGNLFAWAIGQGLGWEVPTNIAVSFGTLTYWLLGRAFGD